MAVVESLLTAYLRADDQRGNDGALVSYQSSLALDTIPPPCCTDLFRELRTTIMFEKPFPVDALVIV